MMGKDIYNERECGYIQKLHRYVLKLTFKRSSQISPCILRYPKAVVSRAKQGCYYGPEGHIKNIETIGFECIATISMTFNLGTIYATVALCIFL